MPGRLELPASPAVLVSRHGLSDAAMYREILDRHGNTIRVRRRDVAAGNLRKIIVATLKISNRRGFEAMSVRDLSVESSLSMGALYAYFDSKERLADMILQQVQAVVERVFAVPVEADGDPLAHMAWLLTTHVYLTEALHPWFMFAFMEARAFHGAVRDRVLASEQFTERLLCNALQQGQERRLFDVPDVTMAAALIKPMLQDWYVKRWKYRQRRITASRFAATLVVFVAAMLRGSAVGPEAPPHP